MPSFADKELKRRIELAERLQRPNGGNYPPLHDPIEDDEATAAIVTAAYAKAKVGMESNKRLGRCHVIWRRVKVILKREHGLRWYSLREMNPHSRFD